MITKTTDIAMDKSLTYNYVLEIADNCLILGQRMGERCGHGPSLEIDIACTNIALDLLGQVRSYYQYAAELLNDGKSEDDIAMLRKEHEYKNVLLVEQPNLDFAHIIARQYFFDAYHYLFLQELPGTQFRQRLAQSRKAWPDVGRPVPYRPGTSRSLLATVRLLVSQGSSGCGAGPTSSPRLDNPILGRQWLRFLHPMLGDGSDPTGESPGPRATVRPG